MVQRKSINETKREREEREKFEREKKYTTGRSNCMQERNRKTRKISCIINDHWYSEWRNKKNNCNERGLTNVKWKNTWGIHNEATISLIILRFTSFILFIQVEWSFSHDSIGKCNHLQVTFTPVQLSTSAYDNLFMYECCTVCAKHSKIRCIHRERRREIVEEAQEQQWWKGWNEMERGRTCKQVTQSDHWFTVGCKQSTRSKQQLIGWGASFFQLNFLVKCKSISGASTFDMMREEQRKTVNCVSIGDERSLCVCARDNAVVKFVDWTHSPVGR